MRITRRPEYRWIVLAMAFLGVFGALGFGRFGYSAVLPSMQVALDLSSAMAGSLASWNLAGYALMAAVGGILASRVGSRKVLTAGMLLTAAGLLVTGVSGGLVGASIGRLVTGIGNGMVLVPAITLMASWFDARQLGLASSIVPSGSSLAMIVVGPAVPRIIEMGGDEGWRLAWYFFAAMTLLLAVLNALFQRDRPYDLAAMRGHTPLHVPRPASTSPVSSADRARKRDGAGAEVMKILRTGYAWHLGTVHLLYGTAFLTYFTFFQKRLTADLQYSPETAGNLFLLIGVAGLAGGVVWGTISDRVGRKSTIVITMVLAGISGLLFAWAPNAAVLALSAVLFGSTGVAFPGLIGAACGDRFGPVLASTALGLLTVLVGIGQAVGPILGGLIADLFASLGPAYIFAGGVFLLAAAIALMLPRPSGSSSHLAPEAL